MDLVEVVKEIGFGLDIGYWIIEVEKRVVYWPKGLGRPQTADSGRSYVASSLDGLLSSVAEADQGRFRGFLADILHGRSDRSIEIAFDASWGGRIQLRLAGRQVGQGRESRIVGLVEVINRWKEAERLAKSLSFIVEALFISSSSGIVIFDDQLRVHRLNRHALELFGITEDQEGEVDWAQTIEKKLPKSTRDLLLEAIANSTAVSGTLTLGGLGGPRLAWRANPWGSGAGELSGLVMIVDAKRAVRAADLAERELLAERRPIVVPAAAETPVVAPPPPVLPPPLPMHGPAETHRHRALEWVKHPVILVSIATGEIAFANRAAREAYHLPADVRSFVENLYDLSGFLCDVDALALTAAGGNVLRLKLGARVGRMLDYDEDLLFIEYHETVPHPHAVPRVLPATARPPTPGSRAPAR